MPEPWRPNGVKWCLILLSFSWNHVSHLWSSLRSAHKIHGWNYICKQMEDWFQQPLDSDHWMKNEPHWKTRVLATHYTLKILVHQLPDHGYLNYWLYSILLQVIVIEAYSNSYFSFFIQIKRAQYKINDCEESVSIKRSMLWKYLKMKIWVDNALTFIAV